MHSARAAKTLHVADALGTREPSAFFQRAIDRAAAEDAQFADRRDTGYRTGALTGVRTYTRPQMERLSEFYGLDAEADFTAEWAALAAQGQREQERVAEWAMAQGERVPTDVLVYRLRSERPLPSVAAGLRAAARRNRPD